MPFKTPINSTLTESQGKALAKLSSVNTFLTAPPKLFQNLSKEQQISTFDFSGRALDNLVGNNVSEIILQQFLGKIFDPVGPDKTLLEEMVVKSIAESLDAKEKQISSGQTNEEWLMQFVLPALTIGKRLLAKQIITMMFGPKELMHEDPIIQEKLLESAACGEKLFSVTNNPSISGKELEFNRVKLREELKNGGVNLTISCQKIVINLPENFVEQFNLQSSETIGLSEEQRPNPATSFILLSNFVQSEVRSQRTEEDASSAKRGFFHILIDKIMSYVNVALSVDPAMTGVFDLINNGLKSNGQQTETPSSIMSNPCEISDTCDSGDEAAFNEKAAFSKNLINSLYALVVSMLVKKLISEARRRVKQVLAEKAREKALSLLARQKQKFKFLNEATEKTTKAQQFASNLSSVKGLFEFFKKES